MSNLPQHLNRIQSLIYLQQRRQKLLNLLAVVIGSAVAILTLGFSFISFIAGLSIAFGASILFRVLSFIQLRKRFYNGDSSAFIKDAMALHEMFSQGHNVASSSAAPPREGVSQITVTIVDTAEKPLGTFKDVEFYDWVDVDDGGGVVRFEYAGIVDMQENFTVPINAFVVEPGIMYKMVDVQRAQSMIY